MKRRPLSRPAWTLKELGDDQLLCNSESGEWVKLAGRWRLEQTPDSRFIVVPENEGAAAALQTRATSVLTVH